jgi:sugar-specific transcriptional regulator TrmB/DNA-binding CsgD family transcriptional regulator
MRALQVLGVDAFEEEAYRLLLERPGLTMRELSRLLGGNTERAQGAVRHLQALGLVTRSASRPVRYSPVPPEQALGALIRREEDGLRQMQLAVAEFQAAFMTSAPSRERPQPVQVVAGREAVIQHVMQLQRGAEDEVLVFDKPPYADNRRQVPAAEADHLRRGVRARVVYDSSALEQPGGLALLRELSELGEEARLHEDVPMKMMIVDRRRAIVPLSDSDPGIHSLALIDESPLLSALVALFEALWLSAIPVSIQSGDGTNGLDAASRSLLTLLAAGLKDDAIASQLGVSRRTVQRRLRVLMGSLGVQSRRQIVLQAARRGYL